MFSLNTVGGHTHVSTAIHVRGVQQPLRHALTRVREVLGEPPRQRTCALIGESNHEFENYRMINYYNHAALFGRGSCKLLPPNSSFYAIHNNVRLLTSFMADLMTSWFLLMAFKMVNDKITLQRRSFLQPLLYRYFSK